MFNPASFDWSDGRALARQTACFCSRPPVGPSASSMFRAHKMDIDTVSSWSSGKCCWPPALLALLALFFDGVPLVEWTLPLVLLLALWRGCGGNALAYWAVAMVNRSLPGGGQPRSGCWQRLSWARSGAAITLG